MTNDAVPVTAELLPCPFCGGEPKFCPDDSYGHCGIGCGCDAEPFVQARKDEPEKAITAWNARHRGSTAVVDGFEAEHDDDTFSIRFPSGHAITARADGRLIVTKAEAGFVPFETNVASLSQTPATSVDEAEKVAAWLEQYPTPLDDLGMVMRIRQICAAIRAGEHRKSDAAPSGEAGEGKPNDVAENKAGGLWYRRWHSAQTRVNELEALLANPRKHKFWGAGEPDCPREIKAPNGELHTLRCKACGLDNPRKDTCFASLSQTHATPISDAGEGE